MRRAFLLLTLLSPLLSNAWAQTPAEKGLAIAQEADRKDAGWKDMQAQMTMTLRNKQGEASSRAIRVRSLEVENDGDKSLSIFDEPRDVKGTAFLSFTHATKPDDQWLYLPALKRVKRISSANKSGPFMGSEFAYEDLSSQEVDKYTYTWLRDEELNGRNAFVIERIPVYENSGYKRQIVWMDQAIHQPLKVEFYDRKDSLLKTLTMHDYKQYLNRYWRSDRMEMVNHQRGKSTSLVWTDYQFGTGLTDRDFDKNSLKRIR
jgi:outer membrane lipoprotein-sorting protein